MISVKSIRICSTICGCLVCSGLVDCLHMLLDAREEMMMIKVLYRLQEYDNGR